MVEVALGAAFTDPAQVSFAGDVLNTAVYAARESADLDVSFISTVGQDSLSDALISFIANQGVDTALISRHPTRILGLYTITRDDQGERSFAYWRGESAARTLVANGLPNFHDFDCIYLSAITLAILPPEDRETLLFELKRSGTKIAFDSNFRLPLWENLEAARYWVTQAWKIATIALPSLDDEAALFGEHNESAIVARLKTHGITRGAIKRGEYGPLALSGEDHGPFPPAFQITDTTAAGDSFNGAYLAAILKGASEADALQRGHARACKTISQIGAITTD